MLVLRKRDGSVMTLSEDRAAVFWSYVARGEPEACWPWLKKKDADGYGRFAYGHGRNVLAHRVAFGLAVRVVEADEKVRHRCDNPPCCNPAHLIPGTQADNVADAVARGRHARGEKLPHTKLTEEQVREIRAETPLKRGRCTALAHKFGVSLMAVWQAANGRTFLWVTP